MGVKLLVKKQPGVVSRVSRGDMSGSSVDGDSL